MGDFNGQIGQGNIYGEKHTIEKYGYGKRSKNGDRLITFALENKLCILNNFYKKKERKDRHGICQVDYTKKKCPKSPRASKTYRLFMYIISTYFFRVIVYNNAELSAIIIRCVSTNTYDVLVKHTTT